MTEPSVTLEDDAEDAQPHAWSDGDHKYPCPYRALWTAVIRQAFDDVRLPSPYALTNVSDGPRQQHLTRNWFLKKNSDFETVCDNAGLNPDAVRYRLRKKIHARA